MPKPRLTDELAALESEIMAVMRAGLKQYRADLDYPQSASDMEGCIRALFQMYEIKRRTLPAPLQYYCYTCEGLGKLKQLVEKNHFNEQTCPDCKGKRYIKG